MEQDFSLLLLEQQPGALPSGLALLCQQTGKEHLKIIENTLHRIIQRNTESTR